LATLPQELVENGPMNPRLIPLPLNLGQVGAGPPHDCLVRAHPRRHRQHEYADQCRVPVKPAALGAVLMKGRRQEVKIDHAPAPTAAPAAAGFAVRVWRTSAVRPRSPRPIATAHAGRYDRANRSAINSVSYTPRSGSPTVHGMSSPFAIVGISVGSCASPPTNVRQSGRCPRNVTEKYRSDR